MNRARAANRLDGLGTTIFAEMSALAVATGSINPGQGFPDTDGPAEIIEAVVDALRTGTNQYPPGPGIPALRAAIAAHDARFHGLAYDPAAEVLVTTGATEAIAAAVLGLVNPGDEVTRAVLRLLRRHDRDGRRATGAGHAAGPGLRARPRRVARRAHPAHPGDPAEHPAQPDRARAQRRRARRRRRGRDLPRPGGDLGRGLRAPDLRRRAYLDRHAAGDARAHRADLLGRQDVLLHRLEDRLGLRDGLRDRRDQLEAGLRELGLEVYTPAGTYFTTSDVRALGYPDGTAFCRDLPHKAGVVAIPLDGFYDDPEAGRTVVRWAFCKRPEVLDAALERLRQAFPPAP